MKRITLAVPVLLVCAATIVARGQTPPAPPARPAQPAPAPMPAPAPKAWDAPRAAKPLPPVEAWGIDRDALERVKEMSLEAREKMRFDIDNDVFREQVRAAEQIGRQIADNRDFIENSRLMAEDARRFAEAAVAPKAAAWAAPMAAAWGAPMARYIGDDGFSRIAAPWAQGEPGDSLYRVGYDAHNRGDYRRAAQIFADLVQRYPKSSYVADAMYNEAFDRYRLGSTEELRTAAKVLEAMSARSGELRRRGSSEADVQGLRARVYGELARRGDNDAQAKLQREVTQAGGTLCDREEQAVKAEALSALAQSDPTAANPIFRNVFQRKDECSADLRQNAVNIIGRRTDADAVTMIVAVAKSDPNLNVRATAIGFLPRLPGDAPGVALEEILKTDTSSTIQRAAVRALYSSDNPKTRLGIRALVERKDISEGLRIQAIQTFQRDRSSTEDIAYLRTAYSKVEGDRLKDAIIGTVSRYGGSDNEQWVIAIAKNPNESSDVRMNAWYAVMRMNLPIADLARMYDAADSRNMRDQVINALGNRNEPEATDKLVEIAKIRTDPNSSRAAINALQRKKNDVKALRALADIIAEGKP